MEVKIKSTAISGEKYPSKILPLHTLLTSREREILRLLSFGRTSREIGEQLFVSIETIKTHRSSIMRKLKATNAAMLIRRGFELRILVPE